MKKTMTELTVEELKAKEKSLKTGFGLLLGMMIVMIIALVALAFLKGASSLVISLGVMPLFFVPILINSKKTLKQVEDELSSRTRV
jgi:uncharacterized membrane protein YgaE (UPF0421/DUF939 family)